MGSTPNFVQGQQPTASQWNGYFGGKADDLDFTGDNGTGGVRGLVPAPPAGAGPAGWVLGASGLWIPGGGGGGGAPGVLVIYATPTSGNTITMTATPATSLVALLLQPAGELSSLTIVLPAAPIPDTLPVEISSTAAIDALTLSTSDGAAILGPSGRVLSAGGGLSLRYRLANTSWYPRY